MDKRALDHLLDEFKHFEEVATRRLGDNKYTEEHERQDLLNLVYWLAEHGIELIIKQKKLLDELEDKATVTCQKCGRAFPRGDTAHYCMGTLESGKIFGLVRIP